MYMGSRLFSKVARYFTLSFASLAASVICMLQKIVSIAYLELSAPDTRDKTYSEIVLPVNIVVALLAHKIRCSGQMAYMQHDAVQSAYLAVPDTC